MARALLTRDPNAGLVWKLLGLSLWMQGKNALQALIQAATLLPDDAEAHTNLGNAFRAAGQLEDAVSSHRQALAIDPGYAEAYNNLGSALRDLQRLDDAVASFQRAVALNAGLAMAHTNLGQALLELGRLDDALISYRQAVAIAPTRAQSHVDLGDALRASWQLDAAVDSYRKALQMNPDDPEVHNKLGNALFFLGRQDEAAACCRRALEIAPDVAELHSNLAMLLMLQNRIPQAEASVRRALELDPALTGAMVLLAELHANEGRFAQAEELLQRAIAIEPDMPEAWAGLVRWRKAARSDATWLSAAQRIVAKNLPARREVHLRYALGKYFDDVRDFEQAFPHYRRANELTRQHNARYDREAMNGYVDSIMRFYDKARLDQLAVESIGSDRPVLIVGMWRSGSTLTEQILASHPSVFGAGELAYWKAAASAYERSALNGTAASPGVASPGVASPGVRQMAADYLRLLQQFSSDATRVVDKMSSNFLHLGLIHAALPDARIIHVRRNPIDTCLSIYFQDFHYGHLYANDLDDLAHYYRQYERVMGHWQHTLPAHAMLEVPYEKLVEDQETWSRAILEFIGLPWDPRCLDFHRTSRTVTTNSKWQVRQAINTSSVERWRNYEKFVGPLRSLAQ